MGDEDDGLAKPFLQGRPLIAHVAAVQRVECPEGLVHEQDPDALASTVRCGNRA